MKESTRKLWEHFPADKKSDFFPAYIYLKYFGHLMEHVLRTQGATTKDSRGELDPGIGELVEAMMQRYAETSASRETNIYHGKVVKLNEAVQLVNRKNDLTLRVPEKVVPFKIARDVIIRNPASVAVGSCVCRAASDTPCLPSPMEACLFIGDPHASFIADENPLFRKGTQEEAVSILEEMHSRGFVHAAYFKHEFGDRFTAICNCCSCHCMGIKAFNLMGVGDRSPFLAPSGYLCHIDEGCTGCGECVTACHFKALSMDEEKEIATVNMQNCMGCGVCVDTCPAGAISLKTEPSKGEPLDIEVLARRMGLE